MRRAPRPHQEKAVAMVRRSIATGHKRPVLQLPTGAGKTFIASLITHLARAKNPKARILFIVDALSLIDQAVSAFEAESIYDLGVIQADHARTNWSRPIQIASVQTLQRRGMPRADLVFVDECHRQNEWLKGIMASEEWEKVPFIGLSATPWSRGLGHVWDDLLVPTSMQNLIDQGFLCPFRVYAAAHPDLTGVKVSKGDYATGELSGVMSDGELVADIVQTWLKLGEGRPSLAFCVDCAHARKVQAKFEAAGIGCGYIDHLTDVEERHRIRAQLDAGEIKVVANVACLTVGVDWAIGCVILARPTKSEMFYVQMVGRGLRVNDGIADCIILDHADNTLRLGFVTDIHHPKLCTAKKGERSQQERPEALPKECPSCALLKAPKMHECPRCGFAPQRKSLLEEKAGELVRVTKAHMRESKAVKQAWLSQLNVIARGRGYSSGWVAQTYKKRFGVWPRGLDEKALAKPTHEVRDFVTSQLIRFAKRRAA